MDQNCLRNSDSNSPAYSQGLPHTLHWPPKLRTPDCRRCTALAPASAAAGEAEGAVEGVVVVPGNRHHNSHDNCPASSRGSAHTVRWPPSLGNTDCHPSMSRAASEGAEVEVAGEVVLVSSWDKHHNSKYNLPA